MVDRYFCTREPTLLRLLNPDYYGRLGGACFYTLLVATKKTSEDKKNLLRFLLEWEFGKGRLGVLDTKVNKPKSAYGIDNSYGSSGAGDHDGAIQIGVNATGLGPSASSGIFGSGSVDANWLGTDLVGPWMTNFARSKESWNGDKHLFVKGDGTFSRTRWNDDNVIILDDPPEQRHTEIEQGEEAFLQTPSPLL